MNFENKYYGLKGCEKVSENMHESRLSNAWLLSVSLPSFSDALPSDFIAVSDM